VAGKEPRGLVRVREKELSQQLCWLSENFLVRNSAALHVSERERVTLGAWFTWWRVRVCLPKRVARGAAA
jgi:hypothetical protein